MGKKTGLILLLVVFAVLTGIVGTSVFFMFFPPRETNVESDISWLPEESHFVDYEIVDGKVRFRYAICFENKAEHAVGIKIAAKFMNEELEGWCQYTDFFEGYDENNEWDYKSIQSGEKVQYIYTFEGEYLGGTVNTSLSFPEELLVSLSFVSAP